MTFVILLTGLIILLALIITKYHLKGKDLSIYDRDVPVTFKTNYNSESQQNLRAHLNEMIAESAQGPKGRAAQLVATRERINQTGLDRDFDAEFVDDMVDMDGLRVPGQWTLIKGHDADRRILYLHGGAFTVGSPLSHRPLTFNLAKRTGCAVFALDYRLIPENRRLACVEDSCAAYRWILENGPKGPAPIKSLTIAGDSAGGNLALVVSNYACDEGLRLAEAIIALSPGVDLTLSSPSINRNVETDLLLGPFLAPFLKIPRSLLLWITWIASKVPPKSPLLSPVRADLSGLPPT